MDKARLTGQIPASRRSGASAPWPVSRRFLLALAWHGVGVFVVWRLRETGVRSRLLIGAQNRGSSTPDSTTAASFGQQYSSGAQRLGDNTYDACCESHPALLGWWEESLEKQEKKKVKCSNELTDRQMVARRHPLSSKDTRIASCLIEGRPTK